MAFYYRTLSLSHAYIHSLDRSLLCILSWLECLLSSSVGFGIVLQSLVGFYKAQFGLSLNGCSRLINSGRNPLITHITFGVMFFKFGALFVIFSICWCHSAGNNLDHYGYDYSTTTDRHMNAATRCINVHPQNSVDLVQVSVLVKGMRKFHLPDCSHNLIEAHLY